MKQKLLIAMMLMMAVTSGCAKKVKVTIDGTIPPLHKNLYLIVNEDTAHAQKLNLVDGKFEVTVKVPQNSFIRLHELKDWPERSLFVLIPDSKHITVDGYASKIEGSPLSQKLREVIKAVDKESPEGFQIDVFSDDPEAHANAHRMREQMYAQMTEKQRKVAMDLILENSDNIIPAWILYTHSRLLEPEIGSYIVSAKPKWASHPILNSK